MVGVGVRRGGLKTDVGASGAGRYDRWAAGAVGPVLVEGVGSVQRRLGVVVGAVLCVVAGAAPGQEGGSPFPFERGQVLTRKDVEKLRDWLPAPFWQHRTLFFYDGMELEIGPAFRDYSPPAVYREATERNAGRASIGREGALVGYRSGQPFPIDAIDCQGDPQAGVKLIWNFIHRWEGFGLRARFRYTYLDRGEKLDLHYQGTTSAWLLKHRPEPRFRETGGDVFENEKRYAVIGFEVESPPEASGTRLLTYRYAASFGPPDEAAREDTWIYSRELRRLRKISQRQRNTAVAGTDFTFDDLFSFSGVPPQYEWTCLGEETVLAPANTKVKGYPYDPKHDFGPSGLSFASDRWELRRAVRVRMEPKDEDHPYSKKEIWLDRQTMDPLYSFAWDNKGELWKIIYHNHRFSEDALDGTAPREWYPGWKSVPEPRDLRVVSDVIANVQIGTGNRLEFWDSHGDPPSLGRIRRYIDINRLRKGR